MKMQLIPGLIKKLIVTLLVGASLLCAPSANTVWASNIPQEYCSDVEKLLRDVGSAVIRYYNDEFIELLAPYMKTPEALTYAQFVELMKPLWEKMAVTSTLLIAEADQACGSSAWTDKQSAKIYKQIYHNILLNAPQIYENYLDARK